MKRLAVIGITVAATVAIVFAAVASVFTVRLDMFENGVVLMYSKQAKECEEGEGCAIMSVREMRDIVTRMLRAHGAKGTSI